MSVVPGEVIVGDEPLVAADAPSSVMTRSNSPSGATRCNAVRPSLVWSTSRTLRTALRSIARFTTTTRCSWWQALPADTADVDTKHMSTCSDSIASTHETPMKELCSGS